MPAKCTLSYWHYVGEAIQTLSPIFPSDNYVSVDKSSVCSCHVRNVIVPRVIDALLLRSRPRSQITTRDAFLQAA